VAEAIRSAVDGMDELDKPILAVVMSAAGTPQALLTGRRPIATFEYPESAAAALGRAADRADWLRRPAGTVSEPADVDLRSAKEVITSALGSGDETWLTPAQGRALLGAYGIPLIPERQAHTEDEALAAARARASGGRQDRRRRGAQDRHRRRGARPPRRG
jgi:acyl-CoA synthetase (NDP forming)